MELLSSRISPPFLNEVSIQCFICEARWSSKNSLQEMPFLGERKYKLVIRHICINILRVITLSTRENCILERGCDVPRIRCYEVKRIILRDKNLFGLTIVIKLRWRLIIYHLERINVSLSPPKPFQPRSGISLIRGANFRPIGDYLHWCLYEVAYIFVAARNNRSFLVCLSITSDESRRATHWHSVPTYNAFICRVCATVIRWQIRS